MIKITLICLGKLKESYLRDACTEYLKRLGTFCAVDIVELTPARLSDNPSPAEIASALAVEAAAVTKSIPPRAKVCALCIEGKELSSEQLAAMLENDASSGTGSLAFVIGSSFGLSDELKQKSDVRLSMSKMTFPHQLARVMLLEQIYRACQINGGGKYHK